MSETHLPNASRLTQLWIAFRDWSWWKRFGLFAVAPWLVVWAWGVATGKPRWPYVSLAILAGVAWLGASDTPHGAP